MQAWKQGALYERAPLLFPQVRRKAVSDFNALQFDLALNLMGFVTRGVSSFRLFRLLGVEAKLGL